MNELHSEEPQLTKILPLLAKIHIMSITIRKCAYFDKQILAKQSSTKSNMYWSALESVTVIHSVIDLVLINSQNKCSI